MSRGGRWSTIPPDSARGGCRGKGRLDEEYGSGAITRLNAVKDIDARRPKCRVGQGRLPAAGPPYCGLFANGRQRRVGRLVDLCCSHATGFWTLQGTDAEIVSPFQGQCGSSRAVTGI